MTQDSATALEHGSSKAPRGEVHVACRETKEGVCEWVVSKAVELHKELVKCFVLLAEEKFLTVFPMTNKLIATF